ncbi:hypothetical protein AB0M43_01760 [Longispora sp. NPDC051575]|uniref:hypothetical protein n=1 Tax=Longispora sp. NPDC051575 TaxID=3154943 RepID=UPI003449C601
MLLVAAYVVVDSSYLMSNGCIGDHGQMVCPTSGPDWARPLPGSVAAMGLVVGLTGLAVGRPIRAGALIAGWS